MNEEEFLLKWNNHQTNFVDVFSHLLRDDSFVDVTLVCGGEAVLGHKMVLAACSPLLHRILRDNPCKHPVLILSDVPAGDMRAMMKFIYQGEVSVSQSELASFLKTADNLQIKGLVENKEKDKDHRSKEERKRKDKEDKSEWRSTSKRQRLSDASSRVAAAEACSPLLSGSFKTISDSHSSHKSRGKAATDENSPKVSSIGGMVGGSLLTQTSNYVSSKTSSSKIVVHGIPSKVLNACNSKENTLQANSTISIEENPLLKPDASDDLTIKTEPLDYPGEMVWTEGHGTINSDILDDPQPILPLGAIPANLESLAIAMTTCPNPPVLDANDVGRCDEESRGDMSTASDDINANTTTAGTCLPGSVVQNSIEAIGNASPAALPQLPPPPPLHPAPPPPPPPPPLPPLSSSSSMLHPLPLPPFKEEQQQEVKEEIYDSQSSPDGFSVPRLPMVSVPIPPPLPPPSAILSSPNVIPLGHSISNPLTAAPVSTSLALTTPSSGAPSNHNNNVHKCQQCSFSTCNPYTFTRHLRIHLGTKEFRCRACSFATSRKDSLIRHFRMRHLTGEMSVYHEMESRDIEELALARDGPEGPQRQNS